MARRVRMSFPTLYAFRQELEDNIVCGGAFVETDGSFELRESVEVEIDLPFCGQSVVLQAEVVSRVNPAVGRGGIAVQFSDGAPEIRQLLSGMVGVDTPLELSQRRDRPDAPVRYHPRSRVRLPSIIEASDDRYVGRTVNMSLSGALLELDGKLPAPGDNVVLSLPHPESRKALRFPARVVRHASSPDQKHRIAVQFDLGPSPDSPKTRLLDLLLKAAHSRLLGRVTGELRVLGAANLLQMLSSSSERGTLVLKRGRHRGRVLFEDSALRYVALDAATGIKALARLLEWTEGDFEFTPTIPVDAPGGTPMSIDMALLEATRHIDELQRMDLSDLRPEGTLHRAPGSRAPEDICKVGVSILAALSDGMPIADLLDALISCDDEIYRALLSLREAGTIRVT